MTAKPADKNVQSGNSRVKVTIYGQVNKAVRVTSTGGSTKVDAVDNDGSSSRIGIRAVGKANPNLTIGGWHELEWQYDRRSATDVGNQGNERVRARHVDLWIDHKDFGQVWIGHGSIAADAADLFAVTGTGHIFGSAGVAADGVTAAKDSAGIASGKSRGWRLFSFFGARENRIMYVTPSLMGARLRLSYGENKSVSAGLRYGGAPPGVKDFSASFALGMRQDPNEATGKRKTAWGLSGGIKHSSGFNISGGYGAERVKGSPARPYSWYAEGGWSGKVNDAGATNIGVGYWRGNDGMYGTAEQYWVAINQNIDAAAADVYAGVAFDSGTVTHTTPGMPAIAAVAPTDAMIIANAAPTAAFEGRSVPTRYTVNPAATDANGDPVPLPADGATIALASDHTTVGDGETAVLDAADTPAAVTTLPDGYASLTYKAATAGSPAVPATPDTMSSVERDGVIIFIAGVRIKF